MSSTHYSERFLNFVQQQLMSYQAEHEHELEHVVVYVARSGDSGSPTLEVVGQWPKSEKILHPVETDTALRTPSSNRRWYPLQEGSILLGVIRAERIASEEEWPESLDQRLQSTYAKARKGVHGRACYHTEPSLSKALEGPLRA